VPEQDVVVVGGGVAGISAALELARHDLNVHLIEKSPFLGGHAIHYSCKANGACRRCNACLVEDQLKELNKAENVLVHLASRIREVERPKGRFRLQTRQLPLFDSEREQEALRSLAHTEGWKHVVRRGPSRHNTPLYALDPSGLENTAIRSTALPDAASDLDLSREPRNELIQAEAVLLTTGFQPFDPYRIGTFNCSSLKNVVSALDLEKLRKISGSHLRPSDGAPPERVAFIQCVGSRNAAHGNLWCSRVCCPYALRMAEAIRSEQPGAEISFFYMDLQNCYRDQNRSLSACCSDFRFIRMMPVDLLAGENDSVTVRYMAPGESIEQESFDMVVLSVGMEPGPDNVSLAGMFDIELNRHGFFRAAPGQQGMPEASGVFPAGAATGPKDIAESMEQAQEAAKDLLTHLSSQEKIDNGYERGLDFHTGSDRRIGVDRHHSGP
jgi:heterodisulfide reductase subunit A